LNQSNFLNPCRILVGQCLEAARLERLDKKFPAPKGQMPTSDIVKSDIGLLALGKSDFDAIEPFRNGRFFREALHSGKMPSSAWMRQRMEGMSAWQRITARGQGTAWPHFGKQRPSPRNRGSECQKDNEWTLVFLIWQEKGQLSGCKKRFFGISHGGQPIVI
jgi:hypothetical protein